VTLRPQFSLRETGEDNLRSPSHATQSGGRIAAQFPRVAHHQISDLMFLEMRPQVLDWIEFGRVGGQCFHHNLSLSAGNEIPDQPAAVDRSSVPKDQEWRSHVTPQCFEEFDNLRTFDSARMNLKIEVPQCYARDDRKTLPAESLLDHRRLAARRPSSHPVRAGAQAAFVDEDNGAPLLQRFFFSFGQT
jgi:hypothetical protein